MKGKVMGEAYWIPKGYQGQGEQRLNSRMTGDALAAGGQGKSGAQTGGKITFMPKQYIHPGEYDYQNGMLKILYQVQNMLGQAVGQCYSQPSGEADEGDDETPACYRWSDQQNINIMNIEQAAILVIQVLTTDMHSGETVVVAKGVLDFAEAQVFTKVNQKYNKIMQKIKLNLDVEDQSATGPGQFVITIKWSPDQKMNKLMDVTQQLGT